MVERFIFEKTPKKFAGMKKVVPSLQTGIAIEKQTQSNVQ